MSSGRDALSLLFRSRPNIDPHLKVRWVGHRLDAAAQVVVDKGLSVAERHDVAQKVQRAMENAIPNLDQVMVHVHPSGLGTDPDATELPSGSADSESHHS